MSSKCQKPLLSIFPVIFQTLKKWLFLGGVQFGGGYYSRITNSQYILYNENNVKIYDFTSPAEHSNGNQKAIYRVIY